MQNAWNEQKSPCWNDVMINFLGINWKDCRPYKEEKYMNQLVYTTYTYTQPLRTHTYHFYNFFYCSLRLCLKFPSYTFVLDRIFLFIDAISYVYMHGFLAIFSSILRYTFCCHVYLISGLIITEPLGKNSC